MLTVVRNNGTVEKRAVYKEGELRLKKLQNNIKELQRRGIKTVNGKIENGVYINQYIQAETGQIYLKNYC